MKFCQLNSTNFAFIYLFAQKRCVDHKFICAIYTIYKSTKCLCVCNAQLALHLSDKNCKNSYICLSRINACHAQLCELSLAFLATYLLTYALKFIYKQMEINKYVQKTPTNANTHNRGNGHSTIFAFAFSCSLISCFCILICTHIHTSVFI